MMPRWVVMWAIALALYGVCKWTTYWQVHTQFGEPSTWLSRVEHRLSLFAGGVRARGQPALIQQSVETRVARQHLVSGFPRGRLGIAAGEIRGQVVFNRSDSVNDDENVFDGATEIGVRSVSVAHQTRAGRTDLRRTLHRPRSPSH